MLLVAGLSLGLDAGLAMGLHGRSGGPTKAQLLRGHQRCGDEELQFGSLPMLKAGAGVSCRLARAPLLRAPLKGLKWGQRR